MTRLEELQEQKSKLETEILNEKDLQQSENVKNLKKYCPPNCLYVPEVDEKNILCSRIVTPEDVISGKEREVDVVMNIKGIFSLIRNILEYKNNAL